MSTTRDRDKDHVMVELPPYQPCDLCGRRGPHYCTGGRHLDRVPGEACGVVTPVDSLISRWDGVEEHLTPQLGPDATEAQVLDAIDSTRAARIEEKLGIIFDSQLSVMRAIGGPLTEDDSFAV